MRTFERGIHCVFFALYVGLGALAALPTLASLFQLALHGSTMESMTLGGLGLALAVILGYLATAHFLASRGRRLGGFMLLAPGILLALWAPHRSVPWSPLLMAVTSLALVDAALGASSLLRLARRS